MGTVGAATGPMCADCAWWCDGNVTSHATEDAYQAAAKRLQHLALCSDVQCAYCLAAIADADAGLPAPEWVGIVADGIIWTDSDGAQAWRMSEAVTLADVLQRNGYATSLFESYSGAASESAR